MFKTIILSTVLIAVSTSVTFAEDKSDRIAKLEIKISKLQQELDVYHAKEARETRNIALYDKMDLEAFATHDMKTIKEIHADNVVVYNPDGSITKGMTPNHANEMQWLFDTFPDITINAHPIKFGSGDWTAGMSVTKGTFSAPMKLPNGKVIQPTGKPFEIRIVTLVKWKDGRIAKEYLFWDNLDWNRQIGISE
jgi:ketosteroid isomerase-like protein